VLLVALQPSQRVARGLIFAMRERDGSTGAGEALVVNQGDEARA
jgi:hypothetical protein